MVISIITAISITVSVIVVNQIKLTSGAANGTQAYYAAESGIEKGLFAVRAMRDDPDFYLDDDTDQDHIDFSAIYIIQGYTDSSFVNNASFDISQAFAETPRIENQEIKENEFVQIDYYDVDNSLSPSAMVVGITVQNSGDNPASWAEVSWTAWDDQGLLGNSTLARKIIGPSDLSSVNGWPINNLDVFDPDSGTGFDGDPVGYRVRIKAFKAIPTDTEPGDLSSVTVIPYDGIPGSSNEVTELPSQVVIKSIGERDGFKQSLVVSVPWKLPLFGLYDYVLFSEGDIYKDIILNAPTYSSGVQNVEAGLTALGNQCAYTTTCDTCQTNGWYGRCPVGTSNVACWAEGGAPGDYWDGTCQIKPETNFYMYGFILPISDTIPAGDEYYVSLDLGYNCKLAADCDERDISIEIDGQSVVINDLAVGEGKVDADNTKWITCTIPDTFSLGDPSLPINDPSRTIQITNHPYGVGGGFDEVGDNIVIDWYQLSTYKMFDDCY